MDQIGILAVNNEQNLIIKARQGDSPSFEQLMNLYLPKIYGLIRRFTGNDIETEDIAQEVFIRVFKHFGKFRGEARFSTWLYRITINQAIRTSQKSRYRYRHAPVETIRNIPDPSIGPLRETIESDQKELMQRMILRLPEKQRAVVLLRINRQLPFKQIAGIMKRNIGTVKANYFQAIKNLKSEIKKEVNS